MSQPSAKTDQLVDPIPAKPKVNWVHVVGIVGAILVFIIVQSLPLVSLSAAAKGTLAILLATVVLWVTQPIPLAFSSLILIIAPMVLGYISPSVAFGGFSGSTFWLVVGVLGMGSCVGASLLSKRLCLFILSAIGKPTFKRVLLVGFVSMFILGYFVPATTAKVAIMLAIFLPIVTLFGVSTKSRIGSALAISLAQIGTATQILTPTAGALTAMIFGIITKGGVNVTFSQWAIIALVPTVLTFAGYYFFISKYAKPETEEAIGGREKIQEELKALPRMSTKEIWTLVVTIGIMIGWLAGLNTTYVALVGILLYVVPGIGAMSFSDLISKGLHWETLLMLGALLAIGPMLDAVGLTEVITGALSIPFSFATNPFLFVISMALLSLLIYVAIIIVPAIPLVTPIIMTAGPLAGVSPILGGMMLLAFTPQFLFWCVAPMFGMAMKDEVGNVKDWTISGIAYFVITVVVWIIWVYVAPALGLIPA